MPKTEESQKRHTMSIYTKLSFACHEVAVMKLQRINMQVLDSTLKWDNKEPIYIYTNNIFMNNGKIITACWCVCVYSFDKFINVVGEFNCSMQSLSRIFAHAYRGKFVLCACIFFWERCDIIYVHRCAKVKRERKKTVVERRGELVSPRLLKMRSKEVIIFLLFPFYNLCPCHMCKPDIAVVIVPIKNL